jgi:hypothetical protein
VAATVTATLESAVVSATVTVAPVPLFYLKGNNTEVIGTADGSPVAPTIAPSGLSGRVVVRGTGYFAFDPSATSDGISFRPGGPQTANTAFLNFSGPQVGKVFKAKGEIRLQLKSAYSFAERQNLAAPNDRYVLDVFDATSRRFALTIYTKAGQLLIAYNTGDTAPKVFAVPQGQEDALFGKDVLLTVRLTWDGSANVLYLNDTEVARGAYKSPNNTNWNAGSSMIIGAQNGAKGSSSGCCAADDYVADVEIR